MSATAASPTPAELLPTIQGNILRGYGNAFIRVRHLVLEIVDPAAARRALGQLVDRGGPGPHLTTGAEWGPSETSPDLCLNVGVTYHGLGALGVGAARLATFPPEFRAGMAARGPLIGDVGPSAPAAWQGGLNQTGRVDLIITLHDTGGHAIEQATDALVAGSKAWTVVGSPWDGRALTRRPTAAAPDRTDHADADQARAVHFGYRDGIAQPRFAGLPRSGQGQDPSGFTPLGAVLVGERSTLAHVHWPIPQPDVLGRHGTFNAFRVLQQDVAAFHQLITTTKAGSRKLDPTLVAAKLCGRFPDGTPLATVEVPGPPGQPARHPIGFADDPDGLQCPLGAHVRRANPRDGVILQRATNESRRVVRRGMPYGPPFDPDHDTGEPRGLLGNFLCANLGAQFEALQNDWINLGFQDPRITGTNDPLVGNHDSLDRPFVFVADPKRPGATRVQLAVPQLVHTVGGAYTFLPSVAALRWLAQGPHP